MGRKRGCSEEYSAAIIYQRWFALHKIFQYCNRFLVDDARCDVVACVIICLFVFCVSTAHIAAEIIYMGLK